MTRPHPGDITILDSSNNYYSDVRVHFMLKKRTIVVCFKDIFIFYTTRYLHLSTSIGNYLNQHIMQNKILPG